MLGQLPQSASIQECEIDIFRYKHTIFDTGSNAKGIKDVDTNTCNDVSSFSFSFISMTSVIGTVVEPVVDIMFPPGLNRSGLLRSAVAAESFLAVAVVGRCLISIRLTRAVLSVIGITTGRWGVLLWMVRSVACRHPLLLGHGGRRG